MITDLKPYPEYKDSGVPWLGDVPKHWEILRAKHVFKAIDIPSKDGTEELLSVSERRGVSPRKNVNVTMFKAESYAGYKLCWPGDLVINSLWAWMQGLGFSKHHGIISSAYGVYRLNKELSDDFKFFDYLLRSNAYLWELRVNSKGIWRSRYQLTDDSFFCIPIIIPESEDRKNIARFLDFKTAQITRFIKAKKRMIELLKEQKQVIINDAVTGKVDVDTGKPYRQYKDSGVEWLGQVPEGWVVYKIKLIASFNPSKIETGFNSASSEYVTFLPMEKVTVDGKIDCSIKMSYKNVCSGFSYFRKDDVVVAKITPCFENGKGAFLNELDTQYGFGTTEFITIRPNSKIEGKLLRMILSSKWFLKIGEKYMTGSAGQKRISDDFIKSFKIGIPSLNVQHEIIHYIETKTATLDLTISRTEREIALMQEYRTRLISDVVTGKIDVRDIKIPDISGIDDTIDETIDEPEGEEDLETAEGEE